ncbi:MAG TPA: hypothetical protein VKM55_20755 [Candidatus Lokiarchaeia archaeon]|nr:hypothetical protein [Candidatus Lokiarchaeia archaeon]
MKNARLACQKKLLITLIAFCVMLVTLAISAKIFIIILIIFLYFLLSYFLPIIRINNYIGKQRMDLEKTIPLLRLEIRFLLKMVRDENDILEIFVEILNSILKISRAHGLQDMYFKLLQGQLAENILKNFDSPSKKLNEFLHACGDINNLKFICMENEYFQQYKIFLKTLESRLVIFVAEGIFLPILTTLVYIFGMLPIPVHFCFLFMHFLILRYITNVLLNKQFSLLYFSDIISGKNNKILDEFIEMLGILGKNVKYNALETGLVKTISQLNQKTLNDLGVILQNNVKDLDFSHFLEEMAFKSNSSIICLISSIILHLKRFAGENLADLIIEITDELKRQKELEEEKNNIVSAERFKIKIVILFIPFILSVLTVLFQVMMIPDNMMTNVSSYVASSQFSFFNGFLLIFLNSSYNYLSCYYLTRIASINSSKKYSVFSTVIFFIMYITIHVSLPTS